MDASADDPQRFRIRRSPSIGSSAAPVTSAARAGKRKLSTAAFGFPPNMAPHPPSSPITSEHPLKENHFRHGVQEPSQIASSSRSAIDHADTSRRLPNKSDNASNNGHSTGPCHAHFSDWQDQHRCHSILAEYEYGQAPEDRRDPRTSSAHLVMPVSSQQPQVLDNGAAQTVQSDDATSSTRLQQPPLSLHCETSTSEQHRLTPANDSMIAPDDKREGMVHRSVSLQSTLSQSSNSVPHSPERGISPSPSFANFGYAAQPCHVSRCLSATAPHPHPSTTQNGSHDSPQSSPCPASPKSAGPSHESNNAASATSRPWPRISSRQLDQAASPKQPPSSSSLDEMHAQQARAEQMVFQLHPAPPAKRRRVEQGAILIDEKRHSSDAGVPSDKMPDSPTIAKPSSDVQAVAAEKQMRSTAGAKLTSLPTKSAGVPTTPAVRASGSSSRPNLTGTVPSPMMDMSAAASNRYTAAQGASSLHTAPSRNQQASVTRRRLVRAQSVPNLRAKATLDVAAPSQHRLILPSYWASYVSSHARTGREGPNSSRNVSSRSSKGLPFNVANYPVASSNHRSRSTFTPALHPPITRHTLRELDLFEILKNPQLRHDVVFDPNVQFRPNFDGERGRRKREAGERYWTAVAREIETGCTCTAFHHGQLLPCSCKAKSRTRQMQPPGFSAGAASGSTKAQGRSTSSTVARQSRIPPRIPLLVQELRTICLSILPSNYPAGDVMEDSKEPPAPSADERDTGDGSQSQATGSEVATGKKLASTWNTTHHQLIAQTLDPHLISQELHHGVLDVPALITFMGSILKLHCAPMRDEAIEKMVEVVCVERNIGKGLRLCFEILELMKLDIANHQLRSARPYLVETAVDFEIRWFKEQIEQAKMSLDKTTVWFQEAMVASADDGSASLSEAVVKAFNHGMVQLIFDVPGSLPAVAPMATPLDSPSSSSLNNTFASHYPETFQFDAYRMMTFHNDVADLTIVYMLVLLFRQLCSTPLDDAGPLPASTSSLLQQQLKTIKGEIWCLLNDANLCLSGSSSVPMPTTANGAHTSRRTAGLDGKLFLGNSEGFAKLDHPRWRRAMQNVLLQVAARVSAIQQAARAGSTDPSTIKACTPSAATQKILNSWIDTNLRSGSALHRICQSRLRNVVLCMLEDKVHNGLQPVSPVPSIASAVVDASAEQLHRPQQKRFNAAASQAEPCKRAKSEASSTSSGSTSTTPAMAAAVTNTASPWDAVMTRAGLEPFAAEIRLLSDRIAKVAVFHLRVFRQLYEGTASSRPKVATNST